MRFLKTLLLGLVLSPTLLAVEPVKPVAYLHAQIWPGDRPPIDKGTLIVHRGRIVAVGPDESVKVPVEAERRDATGQVIIPGLVDTHSHIGIYPRPHVPAHSDGNEMTGPVQSGLRALDAIWPDDPGFRMARAGGVTCVNVMPGSGNVIGGQTVYLKTRGATIEAMRVEAEGVFGGLKMANGENPKGYGRKNQAPFTRMKVAALQREQFLKARDYRRKWEEYRRKAAADAKAQPPETDLSLEPLVEVLDRKRTVHFHCHRADDILTAVRLADEFGFELVLQHATEGYRIADELARRKAFVSLTLADSPGGKLEVANLIEENAAILAKAGVTVAINTDDFITESRFFLRTGSIAVRGGMTEHQALAAMTIHPARMLHLDQRLGSLTAGKDADFVILSGSPFSVYTQVLETFIDGQRVYQRANRADWSYQAGGYALADAQELPPTPALITPPKRAALPEAPVGQADANVIVVLAGRIHTVSGPAIENGAIVIADGRITAIGRRGDVKLPENARVLRAEEVTPGLIDAHSVVGLAGGLNVPADQDQDEISDPNQADLRVLDGFHPEDGLLTFLACNGVTAIHAVPGRANILAGQTGVFRTHGVTAERMALKWPAGVLVNLGEVPKTTYPVKGPSTRMASAAVLRTALAASRDYRRKKLAEPNHFIHPKHESLLPVLDRKYPLFVSAHRADDLMTALRIAEEFQVRVVPSLATEAYRMCDPLIRAKVPVIVHPTMQRSGASMETLHSHLGNAGVLHSRKVPIALCTGYEAYVPKTRLLRTEMAMAAVNGLGREAALRAVTLGAAELLGIAKEVGSLEVGKAADLVLYDGDPLEHTTHVRYTLIAGRVVFDRDDYLKLPFARRVLPLIESGGVGCCLGVW